MHEFTLYWMQNDQHPMFLNPYYRFTTCLTRIKGPKVNDWVDETMRDVQAKLEDYTYIRTSEKLWKDFRENFETTFTDSAVVETAVEELSQLVLDEKDPDSYVARFETLVRRCGYDRTVPGMVAMFRGGLPRWLMA
jgi:hypothetical protein